MCLKDKSLYSNISFIYLPFGLNIGVKITEIFCPTYKLESLLIYYSLF